MKKKIIAMIVLMFVLLVACDDKSVEDELDSKKKDQTELKDLVNDLGTGQTTDESASITSTQLLVTDSDSKEHVYDLPENEFFVSIAPFIHETHPCEIHSLTGCQGEMVDQDLDFYIEDTDGNVILDETINSESNGFIDLWLPRDKTYNVKISHEGKEVESKISTFEKDGTCITTMQLT